MELSALLVAVGVCVFGVGAAALYLGRRKSALESSRRRAEQALGKSAAPRAGAGPGGNLELLAGEAPAQGSGGPGQGAEQDRLQRCLERLYSPTSKESRAVQGETEVAPEVLAFVSERINGLDRFSESYSFFRVLNQPDLGVRKATEIVSKDLVFSSKILKTANSPYFRPKTTVTSIQNALTLLGLSCVISMYFRDHFKFTDSRDQSLLAYSRAVSEHAILTGLCARFVSRIIGPLEKETAFTLGLMHDIGKFVTPDLYARFCPSLASDLGALLKKRPEEETREVGVTHAQVGGLAGLQLGLPQPMDQVIALHHSIESMAPTQAGLSGIAPYLLAVFAADQLAKGLDEKLVPEEVVEPLPAAFHVFLPREKMTALVGSSAFLGEVAKIKASAAVE